MFCIHFTCLPYIAPTDLLPHGIALHCTVWYALAVRPSGGYLADGFCTFARFSMMIIYDDNQTQREWNCHVVARRCCCYRLAGTGLFHPVRVGTRSRQLLADCTTDPKRGRSSIYPYMYIYQTCTYTKNILSFPQRYSLVSDLIPFRLRFIFRQHTSTLTRKDLSPFG